jgi:hypothetical protein
MRMERPSGRMRRAFTVSASWMSRIARMWAWRAGSGTGKAIPDEDEHREEPGMSIAGEGAHPDGDDAGGQRADHGDELEGAPDAGEDESVRRASSTRDESDASDRSRYR